MKIGIVVGEDSGDILGAGLIRSLRQLDPSVEIEAVCGPRMLAAGCTEIASVSELSVMGIFEVLKVLPRILRLRRKVVDHFLQNPPDVFIGIDAPDFNLGVERKLREAGIPTVHYVSPTIWAWRPKRVFKIAASVDHVLTLYPFEVDVYAKHGVKATCVGHTLADSVPTEVDRLTSRRQLGLDETCRTVAILPGSRGGELKYLGAAFAETASWLKQQRPDLQLVAPMANDKVRKMFEEVLEQSDADVKLIDGESQATIGASDCVLVASGTATLECMLVNRPMVVAYRVSFMTYWMVKLLRLLKISNYSMPNVLAGETVVPEYIQYQVQPPLLGKAVLRWLDDQAARETLHKRFEVLGSQLRLDASATAARTVLEIARGDEPER